MNKRVTALLLALALVLSVGMVSALADEETAPAAENAAAAGTGETAQTAAEEDGEAAGAAAGETPAEEAPVIEPEEAEANMVMFAELPELMRKNSPAYKALVAQIRYVDKTKDYVKDLQEQMAHKAVEINIAASAVEMDPTNQAKREALAALQGEQARLQAAVGQYAAVAAQDTAQMEAGCDQMIMGCETIYINLVNLKLKEDSLERQIASLERSREMLQIRQEAGQVSALQMQELENGLATAKAGLESLRASADGLKMQMEQMLGEEITGTFAVGTLPQVTAEQIAAIDVERDLKDVLRRNPGVKAAEAAEDQMLELGVNAMSREMWESLSNANAYSVESAKLQAEAGFRSLYAQLLDKEQAVVVARGALAVEQLTCDAAALKYERGDLSRYALLDAEDALQTAKEAVVTAQNDLFAVYHQYNWAVKYGVLS